jgi:hypothetical protein
MSDKIVIQLDQNATAWELISEVYKNLPSRKERDRWSNLSLGLEDNFVQAKANAEKLGVAFVPVEPM